MQAGVVFQYHGGFPSYPCLFWSTVISAVMGVVCVCTSYATHDFYLTKSNTSENMCTEERVGLWKICDRPCDGLHAGYTCVSINEDEDFIVVSQALESLGLVCAVVGSFLTASALLMKGMTRIKVSIVFLILAGVLGLIGGFTFVLKSRNHVFIPSVTHNVTTVIMDQGPRYSFFVNVVGSLLCLLTALLNSAIWCGSINYGYRQLQESNL